jgi:hypothetical protein
MKKHVLVLITFCFAFQLIAQQELNNYKYIIIPESYDFAQGKDKYQLNSLTKFLFNREGYEAYIISDSLPQDLFNNRCLALSADAEKLKSGLFKTEIQINLKDCYGKLIYTSQVGSSKQKDFGKAYTQALRNAFESFEEFEYQYKPKTINQKNENITQSQPKSLVTSEVPQNEKNKEGVTVSYNVKSVEYTETSKTNSIQESKEIIKTSAEAKPLLNENIYYAQATESGYKLVDAEPKLIMELIRTAQSNTFSVKGKDAIVFKEDGFWYYSEIVDGKTLKTLLNIKFYD